MYLLDTNIISELRKAPSDRANKNVLAWADSVSASSLYLSVVTILEIEIGILKKAKHDQAQADVLRTWLDDYVLKEFSQRVLPIDLVVAKRCAALHAAKPSPYYDALIAATALEHSLTVVTRNTNDFYENGVKLLNPWG